MIDPITVTNPLIISGIAAFCLALIFWGRVDVAVGVFASILYWAYNVDLGPINALWLGVATLFGALAISLIRRRLSGARVVLVSRDDLPFIAWTTIWAFWMTLIYVAFPSPFAERLFKNMVLYNLVSFAVVFVAIRDEAQVRRMILAFIVASLAAGAVSLQLLAQPLVYAIDDPEFRLRGLTGINYLTFAIPFALTAIFGLARMLAVPYVIEKALMAGSLLGAVALLVLTGARQSALGLAVAVIIMLVLLLRRNSSLNRWLIVPVVLAMAVTGWQVYSSTRLSAHWSLVAPDTQVRADYWLTGLRIFGRSIVWGNGFDYMGAESDTAHNMFIDTLASQGMIGFIFLVGFLVFPLRLMLRSASPASNPELASWQIGALGALVFTLVQTFFTGGLAAAPHLFWISALIWRLHTTKPAESFEHAPMGSAAFRYRRFPHVTPPRS